MKYSAEILVRNFVNIGRLFLTDKGTQWGARADEEL